MGRVGAEKCKKEDWSSNGLTGQLHDQVLGHTEHIFSDYLKTRQDSPICSRLNPVNLFKLVVWTNLEIA